MNRWGRAVGAALGLLLLAVASGAAPLRAQSGGSFTPPAECSNPPPPPVERDMTIKVDRPSGTDPRTLPDVDIDALVSNTSTNVLGNRDGEVTEVRAWILACEAGLEVPEPLDALRPAAGSRSVQYLESATFTTNGRYALVIEADGTSTDQEQRARTVAPLQLAVPPKKPVNVSVSDPTNGVVTVKWDYVAPEPDLFGFEIRRAKQGSGTYVTIENGVVGPGTRAVSDSPPVGAWRYHVVAYRQGAPEGAISRDDTVEVAEPAPDADATTDADGDGTTDSTAPGSTGGASAGSGTTARGSTTTLAGSSPGSPGTARSTVDLSNFAAALNARRSAPATRIEPPDPGFQETLPFDVPGQLEIEEEAQELGGDEPNVGLGQRPVSDPGERQRSLGFVAFGLLLFVLSMTGLFVKSEVKRVDLLDRDLDALEGDDLPGPGDDVAAPVVAVAAATRAVRRRRRDSAADVDQGDAAAAEPAEVAPVATPLRRRRRRSPAAADPVPTAEPDPVSPVETGRELDPVAALEPAREPEPDQATIAVATRPRRRRTQTAGSTADATANGSAIEIPETRSRWSGRVTEPVNGHANAPIHDFADLAPAAHTETTPRGRPRSTESPLDAPGLDVPDPATATRRTRPARRAGQAPLPTRQKSSAGRR